MAANYYYQDASRIQEVQVINLTNKERKERKEYNLGTFLLIKSDPDGTI